MRLLVVSSTYPRWADDAEPEFFELHKISVTAYITLPPIQSIF